MRPQDSATPAVRSGLFYDGTTTEVELGDRVLLKRLLRRDIHGVVCYIPGVSRVHEQLEYDDVRQWAIRGPGGDVYPILYDPVRFPPPRDIRFIGRGESSDLNESDALN